MTEDEFKQKINRMRGEIIASMSDIDFSLTSLIAQEIADKNHLPIVISMLLKQNFEYRVSILKNILEHEQLDDKFYKSLTDMQSLRNKFAHSINSFLSYSDTNYESVDKFTLDKFGKNFNGKLIIQEEYYFKEHYDNIEMLNYLNMFFINLARKKLGI